MGQYYTCRNIFCERHSRLGIVAIWRITWTVVERAIGCDLHPCYPHRAGSGWWSSTIARLSKGFFWSDDKKEHHHYPHDHHHQYTPVHDRRKNSFCEWSCVWIDFFSLDAHDIPNYNKINSAIILIVLSKPFPADILQFFLLWWGKPLQNSSAITIFMHIILKKKCSMTEHIRLTCFISLSWYS